METVLTLAEILRTALSKGAVGFTFRSGLHPVIYSAIGVQTCGTQPSNLEAIDELLQQLMSSRERRQLRDTGVACFWCNIGKSHSFLGKAKIEGEELRLDLRKMAR